jgi:nucleoside-diphosphate-sugar epimerase
MTHLVTGAAGFIGSRLCAELLARGSSVVGVDCLRECYSPALKLLNLAPLMDSRGFVFSRGDLSGGTSFLDGLVPEGPLTILHLAARAGVRDSWGTSFAEYSRDNIAATQNILEWAASRGGVDHFVYASSSSVYGIPGEMPMREDLTPAVPHSPYGVTKLAAENLVRLYGANRGLTWTALRLFTVYGPGQRPDMAFHRFIRSALKGSPVTVFGGGGQVRDYTYVDDVVAAMILAGESRGGMVMNLAGGSVATVTRVLEILRDVLGTAVSVTRMPEQPGDVPVTRADTGRAAKILGWKPSCSLEEGLAREADWIRSIPVDL